jgi:hypothetical protein
MALLPWRLQRPSVSTVCSPLSVMLPQIYKRDCCRTSLSAVIRLFRRTSFYRYLPELPITMRFAPMLAVFALCLVKVQPATSRGITHAPLSSVVHSRLNVSQRFRWRHGTPWVASATFMAPQPVRRLVMSNSSLTRGFTVPASIFLATLLDRRRNGETCSVGWLRLRSRLLESGRDGGGLPNR